MFQVASTAPKRNCLRSFAHWLPSCDQTYQLSSTCIRRHIVQGLMRHLNCARTSQLWPSADDLKWFLSVAMPYASLSQRYNHS